MAKLWARLENMLSGVLAFLRAFVRALKSSPYGDRRALPAAPAAPPPALPASNGSSKVALMVVNPYLVHAYWNVDTSRLPPATKSAVLRFHDVSEIAPGPPFDVDIDLRTPNWYVHLWSPAKSYYADLAVKTEGGEFIPLATSNRVETPRAWPAAETPAAETQVGQAVSPAGRQSPPPVSRQWRPPDFVQPPTAAPSPSPPEIPQRSPVSTRPMHANEVLRQRLAQIYALRSFEPRPAVAMAAATSAEASGEVFISRAPETAATTYPDLTALAEHQFFPGLPSSHA